jgi:hypothetical protein
MKFIPRVFWCTAAALAATTLIGCGGGLTVTKVNSAEDKPNNVWVFFTVKDGEEPVGGLTAENFEIYEDDKLVSVSESLQQILNPEVAAVSYTLLLLDMSGSMTANGGTEPLIDAALEFKERVGKSQKVAVYAFDGSEKIHPVVRFTEQEGSLKGGLEGLRNYEADDPSTNLHGAVVRGVEVLKEELDKDEKPLKFGTLVVFTDGTDRAARVSEEEMSEKLRDESYKHYDMFAVGLGMEIDAPSLRKIGKDGAELVNDREKLGAAFDRIAARIEGHMKRFYLLSYCTPSRAGEHRVRIVAKTKEEDTSAEADSEWGVGDNVDLPEDGEEPKKSKKDKKKGRKKASGHLEYTFNADGFGPPPTCNPERKPQFKLEAPVEAEEPEGKDASSDKSKATSAAPAK